MTVIAKSAQTHTAAKKCCGWEEPAIWCHDLWHHRILHYDIISVPLAQGRWWEGLKIREGLKKTGQTWAFGWTSAGWEEPAMSWRHMSWLHMSWRHMSWRHMSWCHMSWCHMSWHMPWHHNNHSYRRESSNYKKRDHRKTNKQTYTKNLRRPGALSQEHTGS